MTKPIYKNRTLTADERVQDLLPQMTIDEKNLSYYAPNGTLCLEPGEIEVYIGTDCLTKNMNVFKII